VAGIEDSGLHNEDDPEAADDQQVCNREISECVDLSKGEG